MYRGLKTYKNTGKNKTLYGYGRYQDIRQK